MKAFQSSYSLVELLKAIEFITYGFKLFLLIAMISRTNGMHHGPTESFPIHYLELKETTKFGVFDHLSSKNNPI